MANFLPLLGDLAGSIADNTWFKTRGGTAVRRKTKPTVSNTPRATFSKAVFAAASAAWKTNTSKIQRTSWANFATLSPTKNKLGQTIFITGRDWFIAIFSFTANNSVATSSDAPIEDGFAPTVTALLEFGGGGALEIAAFAPAETQWAFTQIQVSPPVTPTRTAFTTGWNRTVTYISGAGLPVELIPAGEVISGRQYFVRIRSLDNDGRIQGGAFFASITAP